MIRIKFIRTVARADGTLFLEGTVIPAHITMDHKLALTSYDGYQPPDDCWELQITDMEIATFTNLQRRKMRANGDYG